MRNIITRSLREPIIQFLLLGIALWLLSAWLVPEEARYRIAISERQSERIAAGYARQFGQQPTPEQLRGLIDIYVTDEIAFREGMAMKLDEDDEIVRRRVIQKYNFLSSDQAVPKSPSDAVLARWYSAHKGMYCCPGRTSFVHIYFSPDQHGDAAAHARAKRALEILGDDGAVQVEGDPFPGPADANMLTPDEIARVFGNSPIAEVLPRIPTGRWLGPYKSGYGWHLVRVTGRTPPTTAPLIAIHERVLADYMEAERARLNAARTAKLRQRYSVTYLGKPL